MKFDYKKDKEKDAMIKKKLKKIILLLFFHC